mmetsp:Transcript_28213/g.41965  ORF Transcript_28213/g.41965 Transcript_28213/m.41965 type:complete len:100 (-) Transcript_28213:46-345(-)
MVVSSDMFGSARILFFLAITFRSHGIYESKSESNLLFVNHQKILHQPLFSLSKYHRCHPRKNNNGDIFVRIRLFRQQEESVFDSYRANEAIHLGNCGIV